MWYYNSNNMQQKICFNKKIGFLAFFVIIIVFLVGILNLLTQQKTSTNSKAAEPVPAIVSCNRRGAIVLKDMNGSLWSWASIKTGASTCSSEKILPTDPEFSTFSLRAISYPDTATSGQFRFMEQYAARGAVCTRYGVDIDMESNFTGGLYAPFSAVLFPSYISKVPGVLVATSDYPKLSVGVFDFRSNCNSAGTDPVCKRRVVTIGTQRWNIGYTLCTPIGGKKGCCSANIVTTTSLTPQ